MKVLIVDDNVAIQEIIKDILADEGHNVRLASTVDEAVEKIVSFEPDVIMLDTWVGDEDGMRVITRMHEEEPSQPLKIILIKSSAEQVPKDNPYIKGFIDKPFRSSDVLEVLKDVAEIDLMHSEPPAKKKRGSLFFRSKKERIPAPTADISEEGLIFGISYVIFEKEADDIYKLVGLFDPDEYNILIITSEKAKAIKERFSYDNLEVLSLSPSQKVGSMDIHGLGSLMAYIEGFISKSVRPVVVFDRLDDMIKADGLNSTLMMVHQLICSNNTRLKTFAISVDDTGLTDKDRGILLHDMRQYDFN